MGRSDPLSRSLTEFGRRRRGRTSELEALTSLRFEGANSSDLSALSGCRRRAPQRDVAPFDPLLAVNTARVWRLSPGIAGSLTVLVEPLGFHHVLPGQGNATTGRTAFRLVIAKMGVSVPSLNA